MSGSPERKDEVMGWKSVAPDLTSWYDRTTQWLPGSEVRVGGHKGGACPTGPGDGVCLALTFAGAAAGGQPSLTVVRVAYRKADILGQDADKVRVKGCRVLDILDVAHMIRRGKFSWANLFGANLRGANLARAINVPSLDGWKVGADGVVVKA